MTAEEGRALLERLDLIDESICHYEISILKHVLEAIIRKLVQ